MNKIGMDGYTIDHDNPNIIDVYGTVVKSTTVNEEDKVEMDRIEQNKDLKKLPKVEKEEEIEDESWLLRNGPRIAGVGIVLAILAAAWNKDKIADWFKDFGNDLTKSNTEDEQLVEPDYDTALANAGATLDEQEQEPQVIEDGAYDEVIGGKVLAFTDPYDDEQVYARAEAIYTYLQKSNVKDVTIEELCDQIKFVNGTYNAATDDEAYDILNNFLQTVADYSVATEQSANFAGGVVEDNGVRYAFGFDAFLTDNCEHREIMDEISLAFQNVLSADTMGEKKDASKYMLKLEADLMLGLKETSDGSKIYFHSLTTKEGSGEGFIAGTMFQVANPIIHSALGDNIEIKFEDNIGQEVKIKYETLNEFYNPQCNGEYDTENVWAIYCTDLVETAIAKGLDLTPSK